MIYTDKIVIEGAKIGEVNPIPQLREIGDRKLIPVSEQFNDIEQQRFGAYSNTRMLPYLEQNGYTRKRSPMEIRTIILENKLLRVTFLPDYGGRIYSIYHKIRQQELLYKNKIMQPANLSIRNAWFSGGIEWNIGHLGHSCLTCEPVHFGKVICEDGTEMLRMYEFERMQQLYYQIDFYLEEDRDVLVTYSKIMNKSDQIKPLYYWANIAVDESEGVRVFSNADDVIYVKPYLDENGKMINTFAKGELPYLEGIEGDATYPATFKRSNEYFYQNNREENFPYEAAAYPNGYLFFETSTQPLNYRKMFCWGRHKGGNTWQSYLSGSETEAYLEVQAGVAPTQLHVAKIDGQSEVSFLQVFGGIWIDEVAEREKLFADLKPSTQYVQQCIHKKMRETDRLVLCNVMENASCFPVSEILHYGHNFGYLEAKKREHEKPDNIWVPSMQFEANSDFSDELKLESLIDLYFDHIDATQIPTFSLDQQIPMIMTDLGWESFFLKAIEKDVKNKDWYQYHLSVMYFENGDVVKAERLMKEILMIKSYAVVALTLGSLYQRQKEYEQSIFFTELGIANLVPITIHRFVSNAYHQLFRLYGEMKMYAKIWDVYEVMLSKELEITEEIRMYIVQSAFELEKWEELDSLFELSLDRIREGDNNLVEVWYKRQWKKGLADTVEDARANLTAPKHIDFRMV